MHHVMDKETKLYFGGYGQKGLQKTVTKKAFVVAIFYFTRFLIKLRVCSHVYLLICCLKECH